MKNIVKFYRYMFYFEHFFGRKWFERLLGSKFNRLNRKTELYCEKSTFDSVGKYEIAYELNLKLLDNNKPVLFKNVAKNWKAVQTWSLDYLIKNYGNHEVEIGNNVGLTDPKLKHGFLKQNLKDYINDMKNGNLKYLKLSDLVQNEKSLQSDLDINELKSFVLKGSTGETFYTFLGAENAVTPLHNEFPCNVYVQIFGKKKWTLYHPDDFIFMDTHADRRPYFYSSANPNKVKDASHPLFKYASPIEIYLEPGDVLWVPPFYWHYVENVTNSMSVAYKFANLKKSLSISPFFTSLVLLATKPSPIVSAIKSRISKTDYVLDEKHK